MGFGRKIDEQNLHWTSSKIQLDQIKRKPHSIWECSELWTNIYIYVYIVTKWNETVYSGSSFVELVVPKRLEAAGIILEGDRTCANDIL